MKTRWQVVKKVEQDAVQEVCTCKDFENQDEFWFLSLIGIKKKKIWCIHENDNSNYLDMYFVALMFSSIPSLSWVRLFGTSWAAAHRASLSIANSRSLLKLMCIEQVMPSNHLILCCPFLFLPSVFPSIRVFPDESVLHIRWPKYRSFSFRISPSNEYSGQISFRIDWFALFAVQGIFESFPQHHSSKV